MANKRQKKKNTKKLCSCALCGKRLPTVEGSRVIGITGRGVCGDCLRISQSLIYKVPAVHTPVSEVMSPARLKLELDKAIIGQEQAKTAVSLCLWKQQMRARGSKMPNSGLLLYGPTGCGKTAIVSQAANLLQLPFMVFDATSFSETGYKGADPQDIVKELIQRFGRSEVKNAVVFIDEIDKLAARGNSERRAYSKGTQHSFLKLIEGAEVDGVSTSEMLFVFGGAFGDIRAQENCVDRHIGFGRELAESAEKPTEVGTEEFIAYGMEPEFMGRIGRCVPVVALDKDDLRRIMYESKLSSLVGYQKYFESFGAALEMSEEEEECILNKAVANKLGARGLNALVEEWIEPRLLELSEAI